MLSEISPDLSTAFHSRAKVLKGKLNHREVFAFCVSVSSCSSLPGAICGYKSSQRARGRTVIMTRHRGVRGGRRHYRQGLPVPCETLASVGTGQSHECHECLTSHLCKKKQRECDGGALSILRSCRLKLFFHAARGEKVSDQSCHDFFIKLFTDVLWSGEKLIDGSV